MRILVSFLLEAISSPPSRECIVCCYCHTVARKKVKPFAKFPVRLPPQTAELAANAGRLPRRKRGAFRAESGAPRRQKRQKAGRRVKKRGAPHSVRRPFSLRYRPYCKTASITPPPIQLLAAVQHGVLPRGDARAAARSAVIGRACLRPSGVSGDRLFALVGNGTSPYRKRRSSRRRRGDPVHARDGAAARIERALVAVGDVEDVALQVLADDEPAAALLALSARRGPARGAARGCSTSARCAARPPRPSAGEDAPRAGGQVAPAKICGSCARR